MARRRVVQGGAYYDQDVRELQLEALMEQNNLTRAQAQALLEKGDIERGQLDLGERKLTDEERQSRRETAAKVLGLAAASDVERQRSQSDAISDILRNPAITPSQAATALAGMGRPELFNAQAAEDVKKRDAAINAMIPELQKPMDPAKREQKFKAAMDAITPGGYDLGLARAYPKPGVDTTIKPATYTGPTAAAPATTPGFGELAARLLEGGEGAPAPLPSTAYGYAETKPGQMIQHGQIYGAPEGYDLNVSTGEFVPSSRVGTINGRPSTEVIAEGALRRGVSPEDTRARAAYDVLRERFTPPAVSSTSATTETPMFRGAGAGSDFGSTLAGLTQQNQLTLPTPTPTPTPALAAAYPGAQPTPTITPMTPEMLERLRRQAANR